MIERIQKILQIKKLSPSQFADEIKVQRSSVSHILSGRNKPSLDFILKVLSSYPEINSEWLLFGKGKMTYKNEDVFEEEKSPQNLNTINSVKSKSQIRLEETDSTSQRDELKNKKKESMSEENKSIVRIVVFNSDNTFKEFFPEN